MNATFQTLYSLTLSLTTRFQLQRLHNLERWALRMVHKKECQHLSDRS